MLKRFLKRKVKVTDALVVAFLITGSVGFAAPDIDDFPLIDVPTLTAPTGPESPTGPTLEAFVEDVESAVLDGDADAKFEKWATLFEKVEDGIETIEDINKHEWFEFDDDEDRFAWGGDSEVENEEGITIDGEGPGLVAFSHDGRAVIVNEGTIATDGDFGMVAWADADDSGDEAKAISINKGTIANTGNFGMVALASNNDESNSAFALAKNEGIIENGGNFGMVAWADGDNSEAKIINEKEGVIRNDGDFGMLAVGKNGGDADAFNEGLIANGGDFGMAGFDAFLLNGDEGRIENGGDIGMLIVDGFAINAGTIANGGDFGMLAIESGAVNFGDIENGGDFGMLAYHAGIENEEGATVANKGHFGMVAIQAHAVNEGIVKNGGDFGMAALDGHAKNEGIIENNGAYGMAAVLGGTVENEEGAFIRNKGDFGMVAAGAEEESAVYSGMMEFSSAKNEGIIQNVGKYGMAAFDGASIENEEGALIQNKGDFGMVAVGTHVDPIYGHIEKVSSAKNEGVIDNKGNFGMAAFENAEIENTGFILNEGDFGMAAVGGLQIEGWFPNGDDRDTYTYFARSEAENEEGAIIANKGKYGMAAFDGAIAKNEGYIANEGDFGMVAVGGADVQFGFAEYENHAPVNLYEADGDLEDGWYNEYLVRSRVENEEGAIISNIGNYGMAAFDGAIAENEGRVENQGDFGMIAVGGQETTIRHFYAEDGKWVEDEDEYTPYTYFANSVAFNDGFIANDGKYGMAAFDGGIAINDGEIRNTEDGGMYLEGTDTVGFNYGEIENEGNYGVLMAGNSTFVNYGEVEPLNKNGDDEVYALLAGNGDNTVYMGGRMEGLVHGGLGGTDTLIYEPMGDTHHINHFGEVVDRTFSHLGVDFDYEDGPEYGGKIEINRDLALKASHNTNKTDYNSYNGKINFDQFNGFEFTDVWKEELPSQGPLDTDENIRTEWVDDIYANGQDGYFFNGEIRIEEDANLTLTLAQNRVSVVAARDIEFERTEEGVTGTITQKVMDNFFVNDATEIEVRNILLQEEVDMDEFYINAKDVVGKDISGWEVSYRQNADGSISTIFTRPNVTAASSLFGGYRESVNEYTQSNVDIMNGLKIKDSGYAYARKFAFLEPEVTTTSTTVMKETKNVVAKGKEMVALPATTPEVVTTRTETPYNWMQFGEVFGEAGKYEGNTNQNFDYDTFGVTAATFGRIDERWTAGLTYGYAHSKVDYTKGSEKVDSLGINGLLSNRYGNWLGTAALGYTWSRHDLKRHAFDRDSLIDESILGTNHMSADFDSHIINLGVEFGYNYDLSHMVANTSLYPYAGFDYVWFNRDSYTESGHGNLALDVDKLSYGIPMTKLGVQWETLMDKWTFTADLAWVHTFYDPTEDGAFDVNFKNLNSNAKWNVEGLDIGKDTAVLNLALDYDVTENFTVGVDYTGYARDNQWGNKGGLKFNYKW